MPHPHRRRRGPKPDRRRALELLAASPDGCTEALMFANGFTAELLIELVRAGLASAHAERMVGDGKMTEVARVKEARVKSCSPTARLYTLLCICKSSKQTGNLPGGMWQAGHTARQCGSG
jgi:hypothetical protein